MYQNTSKQWLRMAAAMMIAAVALNPSASYADDPPCSLIPGIGDEECGCIDGHVVICSSGYLWIPGRGECEGYTCDESKTPKVLGNRKTKPGGTSESKTPKVGDPISAGGGEYREYGTLLSLGGGFLPLDFTLGYMPDIDFSTPASDGPAQFPPSDAVKAFTSNTVMRLVEFSDQSITPNTDYVNILMFDGQSCTSSNEYGSVYNRYS